MEFEIAESDMQNAGIEESSTGKDLAEQEG